MLMTKQILSWPVLIGRLIFRKTKDIYHKKPRDNCVRILSIMVMNNLISHVQLMLPEFMCFQILESINLKFQVPSYSSNDSVR